MPTGWNLTSNNGTNQITVTSGTTSGNISVTPSNTCGNGLIRTLAVTSSSIAPAQPSYIIGSKFPIDGSNNIPYKVKKVAGVYYYWTVPINWVIVSGQGTNQIYVNVRGGSGTIEVVPSNSCGSGTSRTLSVTTNDDQDLFVTTWKTDNPGTSTSTQISIPLYGNGYNFTVKWGDGASENKSASPGSTISHSISHTYASAGTYVVTITGAFPRIYFNNSGDRQKILAVENWGNIAWSSMEKAFYGCNNLTVPATDAPNLSSVTNMSWMFAFATEFNDPIGHWTTTNVTNMSSMFAFASNFDQPIGDWNTTNVTNMSSMFQVAYSFNQDLSLWTTTNVTNMSNMFNSASSFDQNISSWNTSKVTNMSSMFSSAYSFNQNISSWSTLLVTDMSSMFYSAYSFNQNLSSWCVTNIPSLPPLFDTSASAWTLARPVWGTCP
jgi:surface protein